MYDIKIINGQVLDLDQGLLKETNILINDGKIVEIGKCLDEAKEVIDAKGLIVSPGFIDSHMHEDYVDFDSKSIKFDTANYMLNMGVTTCVGGNCGFSFDGYSGMEIFINAIEQDGSPVNYILFGGYTTFREACGITNRYVESSPLDQDKIYEEYLKYRDLGVAGVSFGFEYTPGISTNEALNFTKRINQDSMLLSAHFREDGAKAKESVEEMILISSESNMPMRISHIGSCAAVGYMEESLSAIDQARAKGIQVDADCYPYDAFSTFIGSAVFDEGWQERLNAGYENITLLEAPYKKMVCDEDLFKKTREKYPNMMVLASVMNESEIITAYKRPYMSIASDGILKDGQGHPRAAGTFPRVLAKFVREEKEMDMIDALRKMTLLPARWLGLDTKGAIKEGYDADLVLFDPNTIEDKATYSKPTLEPCGIEYVIIDGKVALKIREVINNRAGKFIKGSELRHG